MTGGTFTQNHFRYYALSLFLLGISLHSLLSGKADISANDPINEAIARNSSEDGKCVPFCQTTNRCWALSSKNRLSFLHISKSGGSSWINELKNTIDGTYPLRDEGEEYSVVYQKRQNEFDHLSHHVTSWRSPRHHAWRLWSACRFDDWGKV